MKRSEHIFIRHLFGTKVKKVAKGNHSLNNKQDLSAGNHSLRLPALRPCLLGMFLINKNISKIHRGIIFPSNVKPKNRRTIISALTTISIILPTIIIFTTPKPVSAASLDLTIPDSGFVVSNMAPISNSTILYGESTKSNITIKTDAAWGYSLNIKAKDGATNTLKTSDNKTLNSISSASSDYKTNTTTNLNTWAFLPGKLNSAANSQYQPGPKADLLLGKTSGSNSEPEAYPLSIAAKVDGSQASGTYKNTWTITATANTVNYSVNYDLNGGDDGPSNISSETTENYIILENKTPTKGNSNFLGWCTQPTTDESCIGETKYPGGSYPLTNGEDNINLYARWKEPEPIVAMQDWADCSSLTADNTTTVTLTDIRDNKAYKVAKLRDGNCWMVENLRITGKTISSSDSDMDSESFDIPNAASNFVGTDNNAAYYDTSHGFNSGYYSWYTATAGTGTSSVRTEAPSSICPKGWKLPTNSEFRALGSNLMATPVPGFALSGYYSQSTFSFGNNFGFWWSSVAYNGGKAYALNLATSENGGVSIGYTEKYRGYAVRCFVR